MKQIVCYGKITSIHRVLDRANNDIQQPTTLLHRLLRRMDLPCRGHRAAACPINVGRGAFHPTI